MAPQSPYPAYNNNTLREETSMRLKPLVTALCAGALLAAAPFVQAKELKSIGVTVGDLANPFFVQITKARSWKHANWRGIALK